MTVQTMTKPRPQTLDVGPYPGQMVVIAGYPRERQPRHWYAATPEVIRIAKLEAHLYVAYRALDFMEQHGEGGLYPIGEYAVKQKEVVRIETELSWLARQAGVLGEFDSPVLD